MSKSQYSSSFVAVRFALTAVIGTTLLAFAAIAAASSNDSTAGLISHVAALFRSSEPGDSSSLLGPLTTIEWNNSGTDWATGGNWVGGVAPANSTATDIASFGSTGASPTNPNLGAARSINGISFLSGGYAYTIGGSTLTIGGGGISNSATNIETISNVVRPSASQSWTTGAGGTLVLSNTVDINATAATSRTLTVTGAGDTTFSGVVQNSFAGSTGNLTFTGSGTLTLSNTNAYTGTSTLSGGIVSIQDNSAFGTSGITLGATTLQASGASRTLSNSVSYSTNGATVSGSQSLTFNGSWTDTASRTLTSSITGGNLLTLGGNVFISDNNTTTSRNLTVNGTGLTTIGGVIANNNFGNTVAAGLIYSGSSTLTLTNSNTFTGNTTISSGTVALTGTGSLSSAKISVAGGATFDGSGHTGTVTLTSSQTLDGTGTASSGTINGNLTMGATSPLTLLYASGNPTLSVTNGALTLASGNPVTVTNNGSALSVANYTLISAGTGGSVAGTAPTSVTVNGTGGICGGCTATLAITSSQLVLQVTDTTAPSAPSITGSTPTSPGMSTTPNINGTAEAESTVKLYTTSDCTGGIAGMGTATGGSFAIGVTVTANSTTTFYATATDASSNVSACSTGFSYTSDTIAPSLSYTPLDNTSSTSAIPLAVTSSDSVSMGTVSVFYAINGGSFTSAGCTAGTPPAYDCTIPGQSAGTAVAYYVRATDTAGNTKNVPTNGASAPNLYSVGAATVPAGTYTTISLSDGTTLGGDVLVGTGLTLGGKVTTGSNTLELGCGATVTGAGSANYVIGNFKMNFCATGSFTFPVGNTPDGSRPAGAQIGVSRDDGIVEAPQPLPPAEYTPLSMTVNSGTFPAVVTVTAVDATLGGLDPAKSVSRMWNITQTGGPINADMTFNYLDQDVNGTEADYKVFKRETTTSTEVTSSINTGANTATVMGVTSFSGWGVGLLYPTAGEVSITGRVITADGRGITNAMVTVSGGGLQHPIAAITGPGGYYTLNGLEAGQTYVVTVNSKRFRFATPSRIVSLVDNIAGYDFVALP